MGDRIGSPVEYGPVQVLSEPSQASTTTGTLVPRLVSVVIVTHDSGHCILRYLEHLQRQTCRAFEVLSVDNASTDRSSPKLVEATGNQGSRYGTA
jgi:hypothetical protein